MSALAARRLYIVAYCTVAAVLAWLIVSLAAAGEFAARDPALALRWRPADPEALTQAAQDALNARKLPQARDYAQDAIAHAPHDATAWRLLGEIALVSSNAPLAGQLFAQAGQLTHRDAALAAYFFEDAVRDHRYADAVRYADVVMRRAPEKQSALVFRLAALAQDTRAADALAQAIADKPSWRRPFFRELSAGGASDAGMIQLLESVTARRVRLTPDELSLVLLRLVRDGFAQEAHRLWLAGLPARNRPSSPVYDPSFTGPEAPAPFGWTLDDGADGRSRLALPGEQPGLHIDLRGMGSQRLALQTLVLAPGRYRFDTTARLLDGESGNLTWVIGCPGQRAVNLDLFGGPPTSASVEFEVTLACAIQVLILRAGSRDHATPAAALVTQASVQRIG